MGTACGEMGRRQSAVLCRLSQITCHAHFCFVLPFRQPCVCHATEGLDQRKTSTTRSSALRKVKSQDGRSRPYVYAKEAVKCQKSSSALNLASISSHDGTFAATFNRRSAILCTMLFIAAGRPIVCDGGCCRLWMEMRCVVVQIMQWLIRICLA